MKRGEGCRCSDERMHREFGVSREGESFLPVQGGRASLALCQSGRCAHEEAVRGIERRTDSKREAEMHKCVCGGFLRLTGRSGLV